MHINYKTLSDHSHWGVMEQLTNLSIILLYKLIFEEEPPCMSRGEMEVITKITDWYASLGGTFLRVFNKENLLHVLPRYATNNIFMQEVSYHLNTGLSTSFHRNNKALCPTLLLKIRLYKINNLKVTDTEGKEIVKFAFGTRYFNLYDPYSTCKYHCARIHFHWINVAFHWLEEDPWSYCYNASKLCELASLAGTSWATP